MKTIIDFIKKYIREIILIIVIIFLLFTPIDCFRKNKSIKIDTITDTIWKTKTDTVLKTVKEISYKYIYPKGEKYTPGEHIDTCKARFQYLYKQHSRLSIYSDTISFDSLGVKGTLTIKDTIWLNKFQGKRQYISNLKFPTIEKTTTITKTPDPVRQFYLGGNIFGDQNKLQILTPGIIYKDRKDRIVQVNLGINFDGSLVYGVGYYKKISFRKKE
jgi:hypothetical protein